MQTASPQVISSAFIWRRVHSLMGFWIVLYLIIHLLTNSQAALWFGSEGGGFVRMVDFLESIPYLHAIEIGLIGIPLAVHGVWGIRRALTSRANVHSVDGTKPSLKYERNWAYRWQRITSWILLFGILGHVVQMRFLLMPKHASQNYQEQSMVKISLDDKLYELAQRLGVTLYTKGDIRNLPECKSDEQRQWGQTITSFSLRSNEVIAVAPNPGAPILLMVRDTFKSPWMVALYSIFVLAAAFHAFNGFWTFLIAWGVILSYRSQKAMIPVCMIGAAALALLGLAAIWGSYWI